MPGVTVKPSGALRKAVNTVVTAFIAAVGRLDKSLSPKDTLDALRQHKWTLSDTVYIFHIVFATFWLTIMEAPGFPLKLLLPILYTIALLIPLTRQFFLPATPIFAYLLEFYTSRFIPLAWRPSISVSILPTLEFVLYGANISDILTRFTHPILDLIAWLPYGVFHFSFPFVVAAFLWLFRSKEVLRLWAQAFGWMNVIGVFIQIVFPCSAPWYELIYGLTPADYSVPGSPGGLGRIDALFHSSGYTNAFHHSPVVFGAFPSLHAADATLEVLFMAHFFPQCTSYAWTYVAILYWATMYMTHHYLIDVVAGACLAIVTFYLFLPDELKGAAAIAPPANLPASYRQGSQRSKYDIYDLPPSGRGRAGVRIGGNGEIADSEMSDTSSRASVDEEMDITYRSPVPGQTPSSTTPFLMQMQMGGKNLSKAAVAAFTGKAKKGHRHTASIVSLIRGDERSAEEGWSPVTTSGFVIPPTPTRPTREREDSRRIGR